MMTDYRNGIIAGLCGLCVLASLSGCATPDYLLKSAQRSGDLSRNAKTVECSEAAENAARAALTALQTQSNATKMTDGATAPAVRAAMRLAERVCK